MTTTKTKTTEIITYLLNGTMASIKNVVPIPHRASKPTLQQDSLKLQYGVLIGITGDIKGNLVLTSEIDVFQKIGETMFGMPLGPEMLTSFSGELANMIAGGLSTNMAQYGVKTDISAPTIIEGTTTLSGYRNVISLPLHFEAIGELTIFLLLD